MKIVMYGSGAAGSVFASYLRNGGADMILIDRYKEHMVFPSGFRRPLW